MAPVDQVHCDNTHEAVAKRIADLYEKVSRKAPTTWFVGALATATAAVGGVYLAVFAFSASLGATDAAIRSEIATVRLDSANSQATLRSDIRDLVTTVQALTKATEANNRLLQEHLKPDPKP